MEENKLLIKKLTDNIKLVIKDQAKAIKLIIAALISDGHVLLEDYPGTGKTTFAKTLARSIGTAYKRIQFTPDLLPSDIVGVSIFDQKLNEFKLHKGPIFTNILLADEINRASPRTQSALLEAMEEKQVSIDGIRHQLTSPFFVIATQNPVETAGTYPLPEAQMDRFSMKFSLGYVSKEKEIEILTEKNKSNPFDTLQSVITEEELADLKNTARNINIDESLKEYIVEITRATRAADKVLLGASTRASLALMNVSKSYALIEGNDFVTPQHIKEVAIPVIAHRLLLDQGARFSGITQESIVEDILMKKEIPV